MGIMIPPLNISTTYIGIAREPFETEFYFYFENGDSYMLSPDEAKTFLKLIGIPEDFRVLDYVQNFYSTLLNIRKHKIQPVTREQLTNTMKSLVVLAKQLVGVEDETFAK